MTQAAFFATAVLVLASIPSARAQQAFFMGLGDLPGGDYFSHANHISADGTVVVGWSVFSGHAGFGGASGDNKNEAFRWTRETGMVGIGAIGAQSVATRISDDGSTIIGTTGDNLGSSDGTISRAYRWTAETGMTLLPTQFGVLPRGINADGSIIVGADNWWSAFDGVHPPMPPMDRLYEVSSDGTVFVGYVAGGSGYRWSLQDGITDLSPIPNGGIFYNPALISADGKVIVGSGGSLADGIIRWTKETGAVNLDPLPGGAMPITVGGVSADGSVIVGRARGGTDGGAFIWDAVHGSRNLKQVLIDDYGLGVSVAGWDMRQAFAVSADGRTIVGGSTDGSGVLTSKDDGSLALSDVNPQGQQEAWIAFLGTPVPEPSTLALAALALVPLAWRSTFVREHWQAARLKIDSLDD